MNNINSTKLLSFPELGDDRGQLVVIEGERTVPFIPKRIFYIYGSVKNVVRGCHANIKSHFVLFNVSGSCKVKVKDSFDNEKIYDLHEPNVAVYLPNLIWKEMYDFSSDSILLCLSNEYYCKDEYIRSFDEYIKYCNEQ